MLSYQISNEPRRKTEARRAPSFPKLGQMRKEPRAVPWRLCRCPTSPPSFTSAPPDLRRRLNHDYSGALLEQRVASSTPKVRTRSRRFDPPRRSRVGTARSVTPPNAERAPPPRGALFAHPEARPFPGAAPRERWERLQHSRALDSPAPTPQTHAACAPSTRHPESPHSPPHRRTRTAADAESHAARSSEPSLQARPQPPPGAHPRTRLLIRRRCPPRQTTTARTPSRTATWSS